MEESNVNNLNGVPNFGHGMPEVPEGEMAVTDAGAPEGVDMVPEMPVEAPMEAPAEEAMPEPAAE